MAVHAVFVKQGILHEEPCANLNEAHRLLDQEERKAKARNVPFIRLAVRDAKDNYLESETNVSMVTLRLYYGKEELA